MQGLVDSREDLSFDPGEVGAWRAVDRGGGPDLVLQAPLVAAVRRTDWQGLGPGAKVDGTGLDQVMMGLDQGKAERQGKVGRFRTEF